MKFLILFFVILFQFNTSYCESNLDATYEEQKETFGINSFIEEAEEYSGEFFEDVNIGEILNSAISGNVDNNLLYGKILNLFGSEVLKGISSLACIIVIVIIHSILKSVSENLNRENISKLIFYVEYIAIVTVIMTNFSDVIQLVRDTANNLV